MVQHMTSGDPFQIVWAAGSGTAFSYTLAAATNVCITHATFAGAGNIELNTWVSATSGNYAILENAISPAHVSYKVIIIGGQTLNKTHANMDTYGCVLTGIEL